MNWNLCHRLALKPLLLSLLFTCSQCGKKDDPSAAPNAATPSPSPAALKADSMADHAAKLGFAGKLPAETEFYLGSVNLRQHLTALKASAWWKDIDALIADKTPAPTAGDKSLAVLEKLWGDDFFIAGGQGFAASAGQLREFNHVYNEAYFRMLMTGGAFGAMSGGGEPNPLLFLQAFLNDPGTMEKVAGVLSAFELPPLIAGIKVENAAGVLAEISALKEMKDLQTEKNPFVLSDLTTPQGHPFRVATLDLAKVLPKDDEMKAMLDNLPPGTPEQSRKIIEKTCTDLRGKKLLFAWGVVDGHIIFASGKNLDHLKFATSPAQSLLTRPELAAMLPHAAKNLTALSYASAASLNALNDNQPFAPMLRGAVSAMKEAPMFQNLAATIEKQITEFSAVESKVFTREATSMAAAAWWDRGLHAESIGGIKPQFMLADKPLRFNTLLDRPGVIFGLAYQRNQEHEKAVRLWIEKLIGLTYTAAQELVKAGIAGEQGGQSFAMFELMFLPTIQKAYQSEKDMDEKGLGGEVAWVLDLNGKMPQLPGIPAEAKGLTIPRISGAFEVASRAELANGWKSLNDIVTPLAALAGPMMGGQQGGAPGSQPPAFVIPQPQSSKSGDMTTWFYNAEFFNGDFHPSASISEKLLIVSTSKDVAEEFAAGLAKPAAKQADGCHWKFDLGAVTDWLGRAASLAPQQTPEQQKEFKQVLNWIKPFRAANGRIYVEKGQWRSILDWEITDVVKFD